ncbi:hypothetical protein Cgig2_018937 [Carnegiea gigantea]|uniref:DUF4408 domain-containing protein n=1 Tax=Carnegiea gigantea TaxID=171969 RepID=A0A9Q1GRH5_9CARY|nr:hypothetical protein Cgig2_018937 [Carnegiea gigantea]
MGMMKAVAVSSGVVWVALMSKWLVPVIVEFVHVLWSWVVQPQPQPPYLYLLINCIILSIVASSKLKLHAHPHPHMDMDSPPLVDEFVVSRSTWTPPNIREDAPAEEEKDNQTVDDDDEFVVSRSKWTPPRREMPEEYSNNSKPPVSAREKMCSGEDSAESIEAETAGNAGLHMADDNGGAPDAPETPPEEVRHLLHVSGERWIELRREAESGRVESASGGVHHQVQRGDAVAEGGIVEPLPGDGRPWGRGPLR